MTIDGYKATITFDQAIAIFHGEFVVARGQGTNNFSATTFSALPAEARKLLDANADHCRAFTNVRASTCCDEPGLCLLRSAA